MQNLKRKTQIIYDITYITDNLYSFTFMIYKIKDKGGRGRGVFNDIYLCSAFGLALILEVIFDFWSWGKKLNRLTPPPWGHPKHFTRNAPSSCRVCVKDEGSLWLQLWVGKGLHLHELVEDRWRGPSLWSCDAHDAYEQQEQVSSKSSNGGR